MNTIQHLRKSLGLTVAQLADYLRVTPSQITMSQSGRRNLPSNANIQLTRLLTALQTIQNNAAPDNSISMPTENINNIIIDTNLQLKRLQDKLANMQQQYLQATTFLQVKALLQQQVTTDALEPIWLEAIAADAETQIANNSLEKQALLTIDTQVLAYKLGLLKAL